MNPTDQPLHRLRERKQEVKHSAAYYEGFSNGRSQSGEFTDNPYKHRMDKRRKDWHQGWMDGGAIYLECERCLAKPCLCGFADAVIKQESK